MTVTSHIYAQIAGRTDIFHIADIEYDEGEFGEISTHPGAIAHITESILETLGVMDQVRQDITQDLQSRTQGEDPDRYSSA